MSLRTLLALPLLAAYVHAQPQIPAVTIYQTALANNIVYIDPPAGAAIIAAKAATNWKTVGIQLGGDAALGTVISTATKSLSMSTPWTLGLAGVYELSQFALGKLQQSAPQGTAALSPVLNLNATVSSGAEFTIYASQFGSTQGSKLPKRGSAHAPMVLSTTINGLQVTYAAQGIQTQILAAGARIKGLIAVDVLVGPLLQQPAATVPPPISFPGLGGLGEIDGGDLEAKGE